MRFLTTESKVDSCELTQPHAVMCVTNEVNPDIRGVIRTNSSHRK